MRICRVDPNIAAIGDIQNLPPSFPIAIPNTGCQKKKKDLEVAQQKGALSHIIRLCFY